MTYDDAALTTLYWQLGKRVETQILGSRHAEYGAQIVAALGRQLESRYAGAMETETTGTAEETETDRAAPNTTTSAPRSVVLRRERTPRKSASARRKKP